MTWQELIKTIQDAEVDLDSPVGISMHNDIRDSRLMLKGIQVDHFHDVVQWASLIIEEVAIDAR